MSDDNASSIVIAITVVLVLFVGALIGWAMKPTTKVEFDWNTIEIEYHESEIRGWSEKNIFTYEHDDYFITLYWNPQGRAYITIQKLVDLGELT